MLGGTYGRVVTVIAGTGNNGADGRVAAAWLSAQGVQVRVFEAGSCPSRLPPADLMIDAAFGTGLRAGSGWMAPDVGGIPGAGGRHPQRRGRRRRDVPGPCVDRRPNGDLPGDQAGAVDRVRPDAVEWWTLSTSVSTRHVRRPTSWRPADVATWWPRRRRGGTQVERGGAGGRGKRGHAGCRPSLFIGGGAQRRRPRRHVGAGRCDHVPRRGHRAADRRRRRGRRRCWTTSPASARSSSAPASGGHEDTIASVRRLIADAMVPIVIDGDGLFAAAWSADGPGTSPERTHPTDRSHAARRRVRPADGGAAADDRFAAVRRLACELDCTVLLKGPTTVVADADGRGAGDRSWRRTARHGGFG